MLRSKYFWIAMVILVPFVVVWIMEGIGWAIATLVIMGLLFLFILGSTRRGRRRPIIGDVYDDYEEYEDGGDRIIIETRPRRSSSSGRAINRPIVPINPKGVEFITGAKASRKMQERDLNRTIRRLRR